MATRTLSLTSSDSEVEANHLCGTAKKKSAEKGKKKQKRSRDRREKEKEERKRRDKDALKRLQDEFSSDDDEIDQVLTSVSAQGQ